ncbi:MAG: hypothetical protein R2838_00130 [Caldilineaceae bacterium]
MEDAQRGHGSLILIEVWPASEKAPWRACADWARAQGVTTTTGRCYELA